MSVENILNSVLRRFYRKYKNGNNEHSLLPQKASNSPNHSCINLRLRYLKRNQNIYFLNTLFWSFLNTRISLKQNGWTSSKFYQRSSFFLRCLQAPSLGVSTRYSWNLRNEVEVYIQNPGAREREVAVIEVLTAEVEDKSRGKRLFFFFLLKE